MKNMRLCERNCMQIKDKVLDVPVIQGGMGVGVSLSSLAGAVAANGACGVISSVNAGYDEQDFESSPFKANLRALDYHIKRAKQIAAESTKKGLVAVNIMTAVSHYEESCKTAVSAGADIIISGAGLPLNLPQFTKGTDTLAAPSCLLYTSDAADERLGGGSGGGGGV